MVWSTVLSALEDFSVSSMASSVTSFSIESFSVVRVSLSFLSGTLTVTKILTDNSGTVVVIPEVVRGQWSPVSISGFSVDVTFSGNSEFVSGFHEDWSPWFT